MADLHSGAPDALGAILIRRARPEDRAALKAIFLDTFESTWRPAISLAATESFLAGDRSGLYIDQHGQDFFVAERGGDVVGLIHWQSDFVNALHILATCARQGVGAGLMDLAEAEIAKAGHSAVRLETDTFNTRSRGFYTARGYREADRYPDEEWDSGLTTILFVKALYQDQPAKGR